MLSSAILPNAVFVLPNIDGRPSGKSNSGFAFGGCTVVDDSEVFELLLLPNKFVCGVDWLKLPNTLFATCGGFIGILKRPLCVDGVNLLDPNIAVFDVALSEVDTVFGDKRDFGLDFRGTNGILKTLSSSLDVIVVADGLFIRASMRASGR